MIDSLKINDSLKLGGSVTIQLRNKKGKVIKEIKEHNFITPVVKDFQNFIQRFVITFNTKNGINFSGTGITMPWGFGLNGSKFSVYLKDSDAYPDPNHFLNRHQIGNTVGYADGDLYTGSDTLRGTINSAESNVTENGVKMVFDWPTHAANGTIRSIQFGTYGNVPVFTISIGNSSNISSLYGLSFYNGRFYTYNEKAGYFGYFSRTGLWVPLFSKPAAIPGVTACCYDGAYWYVCYSTTSANNFFKLDAAGNIIYSIKLSIAPSRVAISNGVLAVTDGSTIYEVNPNTGALTGKQILIPVPSLYLTSWGNNGLIAYTSGGTAKYMWFIPIDFSGYFEINTSGSATWYFSFGTVDDGNMFVGYNYYALEYLCLGTIFSRVILPQPIIKTSANTLKVIYEFNYY